MDLIGRLFNTSDGLSRDLPALHVIYRNVLHGTRISNEIATTLHLTFEANCPVFSGLDTQKLWNCAGESVAFRSSFVSIESAFSTSFSQVLARASTIQSTNLST